MQPATADSMYGLAKTRSRVGPADSSTSQTIQPFSFSLKMQMILQKKMGDSATTSMLKKRSRDLNNAGNEDDAAKKISL